MLLLSLYSFSTAHAYKTEKKNKKNQNTEGKHTERTDSGLFLNIHEVPLMNYQAKKIEGQKFTSQQLASQALSIAEFKRNVS